MLRYFLFYILVVASAVNASAVNDWHRVKMNLSGGGWFLWRDTLALWQNESIYLDFEEAAKHRSVEPSKGWDILMSKEALPIKVPGTAEEYLQKKAGPDGDILGVTWWSRIINIPSFNKKQRVLLKCESSRLRAEIFINHKLAGYQMMENVPYEIDITQFVQSGQPAELNVRITDAGGIHDWRDFLQFKWGEKILSSGHGFGGITGNVSLEIVNDLNVDDIYIQNTPSVTKVNAQIFLNNYGHQKQKTDILITVYEWGKSNHILYSKRLTDVSLANKLDTVCVEIDAPNAKIWDLENPNLYVCNVKLIHDDSVVDSYEQRFGFRWFDVVGIGKDAQFHLNGRRIMLRSAISWSFWPINGIFPSDDMAKKQIIQAKELGLNMLNMHRFVGAAKVLDYADELGLLIYEEPGGGRLLDTKTPFNNELLKNKVISMVKRDRSRPSVIVYNLMNEALDVPSEKLDLEISLLKTIHALDPTRFVLRTSAWAKTNGAEEQAKIHLRPYDNTVYWNGWFDYHRATGPASWDDSFYQGPQNYYNNSSNREEIVFWGEEGALSSPPRLGLIKNEIQTSEYKGWDGEQYLNWYDRFNSFIEKKGLKPVYPSVDDLCKAMSEVSYEHQGRKIELARINNVSDGYAINGWESIAIENHSGVVDCFRNLKSRSSIISRYNQPLYVAVKPRTQFGKVADKILVDFYLVNEKNIKGQYALAIDMIDVEGKGYHVGTYNVLLSGGDVFGELLLEGISVTLPRKGGICKIYARLLDQNHGTVTSGYEEVVSVDLAVKKSIGKGAVWEEGDVIKDFLRKDLGIEVANYTDKQDKLDWVIVAHSPKNRQPSSIPTNLLKASNGEQGFDVTYYDGLNFDKEVYREVVKDLNLTVLEGATPSPNVHMLKNYSIIWKSDLTPAVSGEYRLIVESNNRSIIDVAVNGQVVYAVDETFKRVGDGRVWLEAGKTVNLEVRFKQPSFRASCRLVWAVPDKKLPNPQLLMDKVKSGTKVFILQNTIDWQEYISKNSNASFKNKFFVGKNWLGGVMFSKPHPVLKDLPSGTALNWPFQALIHSGDDRMGLDMDGEELIIGAYHTYPMELGTAMGTIQMGRGELLFSTLDIYNNLLKTEPSSLVAKKMLLNMIEY